MPKIFKSKITIGIIVVLIIIIGVRLIFFGHGSKYQFIAVASGSITETVSITGNTTPSQSVSLAFNSSGVISHTYSNLGKQVKSGQVLAELDTSDLAAQLKQAQANVDAEQAKLASLQAGTTPQQLSIDQSAVVSAQTALANAIENGNVQAGDGIQNKIAPFFDTNNTIQEPLTLDSKYYNLLPPMLGTITAWNSELNTTTPGDPEKLAQDADKYLSSLISSVDSVNSDISLQANQTAIPLSTIQSLLAQVTAVRLTLTNTKTSIDNALAALTSAEGALTLAQAGSTVNDIAAEQAQVEQAQASVESAQAKLENAQIVAPISGTVTQFDAKVGQLASPNTPLVSVMSDAGYEVDAGVSEIDIGKVAISDSATMTLDAFSNETFNGTVFYIAPSETNTGGVITYLVKILFDKPDLRLKSGLTANIDIQTKHKDSVLILPQYAILQNDQGTFVETLVDNKIKQNPVVLGIQDEKGNVEVVSGVTEGEQVLNIGLKS